MFTVISPRLTSALLLIVCLFAGSRTANAQNDPLPNDPLSLESSQLESTQLDPDAESLRDLFEQGEYFDGEGEDSLSELLKKARELDASDGVTKDAAEDEPDRDNDLKDNDLNDNELGDDEPTDALDESDASDEQDEERSQAEEEMKARYARQRALAKHLQRLQKPLHQVRLASVTSPMQQAPPNRAAAAISHQGHQWVTATGATAKIADRYPTRVAHRPLYFQELNLERGGRGYGCMQNAVSGAHFLFNTIVLPYRLATQPPECCVESQGDCRTCHSFPTNIEPLVDGGKDRHGILSEAAALAGFTFLLL